MLIDLGKLPEDFEIAEVYDTGWWHPVQEDEQVVALDAPLHAMVRVQKAGNKYLVEGKMSGGVQVRCDRCLEPYHLDLDTAFHLFLMVVPSEHGEAAEVELLDEDMEVDFINGEQIDLDEILREQVFLSLPMKCICADGCRGLCPACGGNLNKGECSCRKSKGHSAFLKLKDLKIHDDRGE